MKIVKEQKMEKFFSRRARRVRREDPRRNKLQGHAVTFWNLSFPVSPVTSSAAGERKKSLSLTEPAGFAEKTKIQDSGFRNQD
jgi:hypothetical protein